MILCLISVLKYLSYIIPDSRYFSVVTHWINRTQINYYCYPILQMRNKDINNFPIWNGYQVEEPGICSLIVLLNDLHSSNKLYKSRYNACRVYGALLCVFSTQKVLAHILTDWKYVNGIPLWTYTGLNICHAISQQPWQCGRELAFPESFLCFI